MSANHKLTALIKGRSINVTGNEDGKTTISFTDGSQMTIKTAGTFNNSSTGGTVRGVRQQGTELHLDFEDGSSILIQTAEVTSCVMLRDQSGVLEYAD